MPRDASTHTHARTHAYTHTLQIHLFLSPPLAPLLSHIFQSPPSGYHELPEHRAARERQRRAYDALCRRGLLDRRLLPLLWPDRPAAHREALGERETGRGGGGGGKGEEMGQGRGDGTGVG